MIVTLSGITGIGKSFFKKVISEKLGFQNLVIITTRPKRFDEKEGIDKAFVTDTEFEKLKENGIIAYDFEFLGYKYGYRKDNLESNENQVTEVHYSTISDFKKFANNVFAIYMIPNDIERAKKELEKRRLPIEIEKKRLKEIEEHIKEFAKNKQLQSQFDCIFFNNYDYESEERLLNIVQKKLNEEVIL